MIKGNSARPEKAKGLKRLKLAQSDIYGNTWCSPVVYRRRQAGGENELVQIVSQLRLKLFTSYNFLYLPIDLCGIDRLSGKIIRVE